MPKGKLTLKQLDMLVRAQGTATLDIPMPGSNCFAVDVTILGTKKRFGRLDVLVSPLRGVGNAYVTRARLRP